MRVSTSLYLAAALLMAASLAAPPGLSAQARQTSTLTGKITDESGAVLPGATVTVRAPNLVGGAQTTVSDADGNFRFPILPPGVYEMTVELPSFRTVRRTDIRLALATTVTIDTQMAIATVAETITVTAESPVVDAKSAAANVQIDDEILQNLPTGRFQPDVVNLAPGVNGNVAFGGAQSSNALLIDGVDVSDPSGGSPWSFFNYNWIGEVQIVSLGANAEYGEFTGLAANSVVRSGSNKFSGLFEYWTVRNKWLSDNTGNLPADLQDTFDPNEIKTRYDTSAQIGGPLVHDKLFFFTGVQYYKNVDRPAGFNGGFTSEKDPRFITKVTWGASDKVRVEGFVEWDKFDVTGRGASTTRPPETTVIEPSPEVNWNGKVTWTINDKTLLDVRNGGYDGYFPLEPTPPNSRQGPRPHLDGLTGEYSINAPYFARSDRNRNVTAVTLTKFVDQFAGKNHEFKFGFEFERSKLRDESGYPGGALYYDYGGAPYLAYLWDGYVLTGTGKRTTLYAQDTWTLNERLTLSPGIRFNFNRGSVPSAGTVLKTNPVSPRIGFALDVMGDHKTVVRGHYGRYHDALLGSTYQFMDPTGQFPFITAAVFSEGGCANGIGPECAELDRFTPEGNFAINSDIKPSYVDQFIVGVERELFPAFSLQAQYVHRAFKDFMGFVDTASRYEPVQVTDPGPDGAVGTGDDGGLITAFNLLNPGESFRELTNPNGAFRDYDAFQLIGRKRYSNNWQLNASYTWSKATGTVNNAFGTNGASNFSGGDLGQTGVFANPNRRANADGNSIFDYTHQLKLEGTYRVPVWGGFNVSAVYRYTTGLAWGRRAPIRNVLDQGTETVRIEPRGTRRTDPLNQMDLRVEKTFNLGAADRTIGVFADIFNLNNQGVIDNESRLGILDNSASNFGEPNRWIDPRLVRAGLRFTF